MLVLSRKEAETICIGDGITITVSQIRGNRVRISVDAPRNVRILRGELLTSPAVALVDSKVAAPRSVNPAF